jgi:threonine/homoserine/homoserine lactone efflux protein
MKELYPLLAPLAIFASVASITPGPNNMMLTAAGANFGFRRTMPHIAGIATGFMVLLLGIVAGLGALFERYPGVQAGLKYAGSAYLFFFAWKVATMARTREDGDVGKPFSFLQALSFQFINPKGWLMGLSAVAAFTLAGDGYPLSAAVLCLVFAITTVAATTVWAAFGTAIGRVLHTDRSYRVFNAAMGVLTASSVILLFV